VTPTPQALVPVGPSLWGSVWRSRDAPGFYRVLAMDQVGGPARQQIRGWVDRPARRGVARIVEAGQRPEDQSFIIRYHLPAPRSLTEHLEHATPRARLDCAIALLTVFPDWVATVGDGFLPSPADVVLAADGLPCLLPMPGPPPPDVRTVLAEPELAWQLAPELVCGRPAGSPQAADRYALGMLAMRLFGRPEPCQAAELLQRVATGTAMQRPGLDSALPFWMQRLDMPRRLQAGIDRLLHRDPTARVAVDLGSLAHQLVELRDWTEPRRAVVRLRGANKHAQAYLVVQDALLEEDEPYELLLEGAELAAEVLGRPLEAVDLLERAISLHPDRPTAYERQLYLLFQVLATGELGFATAGSRPDEATGARLDDLVERDFERLPPGHQQAVELRVARHLLGRGRFERVLQLMHPRLVRDGTWEWWRLGLNLAYATALMRVGRIEDAAAMTARIRDRLDRARADRALPPAEIAASTMELDALEAQLATEREQAP
jgi:tetratricopeptide (TPR) repeat protein